MNIGIDIVINQISQNVLSMDEGLDWFAKFTRKDKVQILRRVVYFALQSGATWRDITEALKWSMLKPTYTPCVLLLKALEGPLDRKSLSLALNKIVNLPEAESEKSFTLLMSLFSLADKKRRESGLCPEKYWWHRDLSRKDVVEIILEEYRNRELH